MDEKKVFDGLPASIVTEALTRGETIARSIAESVDGWRTAASGLRAVMKGKQAIRRIGDEDYSQDPVYGIALNAVTETLPGHAIVCAAAFGVEGLSPREASQSVPRVSLYLDSSPVDSAAVIGAVAHERAVRMAVEIDRGIVLISGSLSGPLVSVLGTLVAALRAKEEAVAREFLVGLKETIPALETLLSPAGNGVVIRAGIAPPGNDRELMKLFGADPGVDEQVAMSFILEEGEFSVPLPVGNQSLDPVRNLPLADEKFAAVAGRLVSAAEDIFATYFRPYEWAPAIRIEIPGAVGKDAGAVGKLLSAIRGQFAAPKLSGPYPVHAAEAMARSLNGVTTALGRMSRAEILRILENDLGKLYPLMMATGPYSGEEND